METISPRRKRIESVVLPVMVGVALVAVWHAAVVLSGTKVLPSPLAVWRGAGELLRSGILLRYIRDSLLRVGGGFTLAIVAGIPLGLVLGFYPSAEAAVNPIVQVLRPISPLAWIPIAIAIFGIAPAAAISLIFLGSLFPIIVSSASA